MRRPRMTIRGWMVVVAIAAVVCLGVERYMALRRLREHEAMVARYNALKALRLAKKAFRQAETERWLELNKSRSNYIKSLNTTKSSGAMRSSTNE
jgi:hypothetical protein